MLHKIQNFFLVLQQSDEGTKKRWLFILTSLSMVLVIGLWGIYINYTVQDINKTQPIEKNGFIETFRRGMEILTKEISLKSSRVIAYLRSFTSQTNSIIIHGANFNFILEELEEIKLQELP